VRRGQGWLLKMPMAVARSSAKTSDLAAEKTFAALAIKFIMNDEN